MSAAQVTGDPFCACGCGGWLGRCSVPLPSLRDAYRLPRIALPYGFDEEEPYPTTPPGVLLMPEDEPIDRKNAPTEAGDLKPATLPPPAEKTDPSSVLVEATKGDSYFASAAREFSACLVELRETKGLIAEGFRSQGSDLHFIRRELQNFGARLTTNESSTRDLRGEVADLKQTISDALERIAALEVELERRK